MAISERKRQKKLKKKKQKQNLAKKLSNTISSKNPVTLYSKFPIYECLVPENLFDVGIGTVIISRRSQFGEIGISAFVVDVFCLGVKNALFTIADENKYETIIKPQLTQDHEADFENIHPSCVRKLIEDSVKYAQDLGFSAHPDYKKYKAIFGDIDKSMCSENYAFGQDGKPIYISGPNETPQQAKRIVNHLIKVCGEGNFEYMLDIGDSLGE